MCGAAAQSTTGYFWTMSNSVFLSEIRGNEFSLRYHHVREGLEREGVRRGSLSFTGIVRGREVSGSGYLYSGRCGKRISYGATGIFSPDYSKLSISGIAHLLDGKCNQVESGQKISATYESMMPPGEIAAIFEGVARSTQGPLSDIAGIAAEHTTFAHRAGLSERERLSLSRAKDVAIATGEAVRWESENGKSAVTVRGGGNEFVMGGRRCRVIRKDDVIVDGIEVPPYSSTECLHGQEWKEA